MAKHSITKFGSMGRTLTTVALVAMLAGCGVVGGKKGGPKTPVVGNRTSILSNEQGIEVDPTLADVPVTLPEFYATFVGLELGVVAAVFMAASQSVGS